MILKDIYNYLALEITNYISVLTHTCTKCGTRDASGLDMDKEGFICTSCLYTDVEIIDIYENTYGVSYEEVCLQEHFAEMGEIYRTGGFVDTDEAPF